MSNFKKLLTATVAVSGAFLLAACSKTATKSAKPVSSSGYEKSINWMTTSELESLDPAKADDTDSEEQIANTYEGLYRLGENSKTVPGVATKSTTSKDGLTWTFYLRKDAKWSNGDPVTAEDFVYAWRRQVDPKTASSQVNNYEGIKNAIKISEGKKKPSSLGVKAEGKYKLVVTFEKKIPYFKVVTAISLKPLDSKAVKKYGKRYGTKSAYAVYNGPFKSVGWTGSNLTWKLDAAILDTQAAKRMKGKKGYRVLTLGNTTYLCYNYKKKKIFRNVNLRRAISMAINRKQLLSTIGTYNTQAKTFSATNVVLDGKNFAQEAESANSSVNKYVEYDLKSARSYFKKALKELGVKKVSFTLMADDDDSYKKQTEFIQSALTEAFGGKMTVSVNNLPKTTRVSRQIANKFDVVLGGLTSDFPDPYHFLAYMQSGQTYNFGKWSNKEYDKAVKASLTMDKTKRRKALLKGEKILIDQEAISPLYHMGQAWMIRPNIKNLVFNGEYPDFKTTYAVKN
ncbi:peptide ABC transporter substrate-binding protein [Lactobacillus delbrueckii]|uniref:peptide ABC transporter substrate-binding protein n=1 Tax=Lactobacillus delbrueckii TaxID=1584 RepID=UPI001E341C2E|nr:peptide ABC transporter substrate-binding protein [Lactobacillus delbrueckii subsp. lactis]